MIRDRLLFLSERYKYNNNTILKSHDLLTLSISTSIFFTSKVIKKKLSILNYNFESDFEDSKSDF